MAPTPPNDEQIDAIVLEGVGFAYPPNGPRQEPTRALSGVTMRVRAGSRLGILGPNGGGKSTLLNLILGIDTPDTGSIRVFGQTPAHARAMGLIGYLPQKIRAEMGWPISVRQMVALPMECRLKPWQRLGTQEQESIERAIRMVGLSDDADRAIGMLSGGQVQRAMIARAIAGSPKLLVLDEPMVGVDVSGQHQFAELVNTLHQELGLTTVIVTHDLRAIAAVADRVACLSRTLHFHDDTDGLTPQVLADVFAHDVAAVFGDVHVDAHLAEECDDPSHQHHTGGCCGDEGVDS